MWCSLSIVTFNCDLPKVNPARRQGPGCANLKPLSEIPPTHRLLEREHLCSWTTSIWNCPTVIHFLPINMTISYRWLRIGNWRKGNLCYVVTGSLAGLSLAVMWKIKSTKWTGWSNSRYLQAECLNLQEMRREKDTLRKACETWRSWEFMASKSLSLPGQQRMLKLSNGFWAKIQSKALPGEHLLKMSWRHGCGIHYQSLSNSPVYQISNIPQYTLPLKRKDAFSFSRVCLHGPLK